MPEGAAVFFLCDNRPPAAPPLPPRPTAGDDRASAEKLESELHTLGATVARQWGKTEELAALRSEREALQKRIDATLKEAEQQNKPIGEAA